MHDEYTTVIPVDASVQVKPAAAVGPQMLTETVDPETVVVPVRQHIPEVVHYDADVQAE